MFPLFEDYTIENFCRYLTQMGIGTELAKESRPPTVVYIDVAKGPISRINISIDSYEGAQGAEIEHCIDYVVPDFRMTKEFPDIHLAVAYTRKGFLWGKRVVDIRWDGNDFGLGVKDFLNRDESLKAQIMEASADNLQIKSNIKAKSWIITTGRGYGASWPRYVLWRCNQAIAQRLLGRADRGSLFPTTPEDNFPTTAR